MSLEIVSIVGPTASGKSSLAIELWQELSRIGVDSEIVNSDAMQVYRCLDIGTAKTSAEIRASIPHHLIDILDPDQEFTAKQYQVAFDLVVADLQSRGKLPIVVGGSMFYISSALDNLDFSPTDQSVRDEIEATVAKKGIGYLVNELTRRDPASLEHIPIGNVRKLIRALEVNILTGEPYRHSLPQPSFRRPTIQFGLRRDRAELVTAIDQRVDTMWQDGLPHEAQSLLDRGLKLGRTASVAIGYRQVFAQLAGEMTQPQAIEETKQLTRRYARRQMSWFGRDKRTIWLTDADVADLARQIRLAS